MRAGLPQLHRLLVQLAGAASGAGHEPVPHGLDALLAVGVQEDDDGVPLRVVERVHGFGRHVQQGVSVLRGEEFTESGSVFQCFSFAFSLTARRTCSMICLMVLSRTTPEDFSVPASLGSVSGRGDKYFMTNAKERFFFFTILSGFQKSGACVPLCFIVKFLYLSLFFHLFIFIFSIITTVYHDYYRLSLVLYIIVKGGHFKQKYYSIIRGK